jgi:hypothetical protein
VFWLMWLLPGSAVVAGLSTLAIALRHGDRTLPVEYHWEGEHLEHDFALARNAAAHGIVVEFVSNAAHGECVATVRSAPNDPASLTLLLTNGAEVGLDRVVYLGRVAAGQYAGRCAAIPAGHWRVSLEDSAGQWSIRTQLTGGMTHLTLRARSPDGGS